MVTWLFHAHILNCCALILTSFEACFCAAVNNIFRGLPGTEARTMNSQDLQSVYTVNLLNNANVTKTKIKQAHNVE